MKTVPTALIAPLFNPTTFAESGKADGLLAEVRRDYPLARAEVPGYDPHWIVSRHADIQEVSRQNDLFHNADRSATVIPQMGETLVQQFTSGDFNLFRSLVQLGGRRAVRGAVAQSIQKNSRRTHRIRSSKCAVVARDGRHRCRAGIAQDRPN